MDRLFRNPKTGKPLAKSSLAFRICKVIDLADPGKLPKCHDVRKTAVSLAWVRGLSCAEVVSRAFWKSAHVFIIRYLNAQVSGSRCVALNLPTRTVD